MKIQLKAFGEIDELRVSVDESGEITLLRHVERFGHPHHRVTRLSGKEFDQVAEAVREMRDKLKKVRK